MRNIIKENPWTFILTFVGMIIGAMLPFGLEILTNYDYTQIVKDPVEFLIGYAIGIPLGIMVKIINGLIVGIFGMIIGIIIDRNKNNGGYL